MQHFLEEFQLTKTLFLCFKNAFTLKQIKKKQFCMKLCNVQGGQCQLNIQITQVKTPVIKDIIPGWSFGNPIIWTSIWPCHLLYKTNILQRLKFITLKSTPLKNISYCHSGCCSYRRFLWQSDFLAF